MKPAESRCTACCALCKTHPHVWHYCRLRGVLWLVHLDSEKGGGEGAATKAFPVEAEREGGFQCFIAELVYVPYIISYWYQVAYLSKTHHTPRTCLVNIIWYICSGILVDATVSSARKKFSCWTQPAWRHKHKRGTPKAWDNHEQKNVYARVCAYQVRLH